MAQKKPRGLGCLGIILIGFGMYWFVGSELKNHKPAAAVAVEDNLVAAVREAQAVVGRRLKNPDNAKWPGLLGGVDLRTHAHKNPDGSYAIKSFVDAITPIGTRKRVWFLATARGAGNHWTISDVAVDE